ncbi:MAG: hypothetical protein K8R44_06695 [Sulfurimonas sp.]|nr:hypothetical protein [Sulfurimonas sp.]
MVKILLFLTLLIFSTLSANKVLYLSYEKIPQRVIKGEIFSITVKTISTVENFRDIEYKFSNHNGVKPLSLIPDREIKGNFYFEKFYFLTTKNKAKLPDINVKLIADTEFEETLLVGPKLNVVTLNPKKNFSNIIANSFELTEYKTTAFDTKHNIIIFTAKAENSDLSSLKFQNVFKQGIESINNSYFEAKVTYFLVLNKDLEQFSFTYFNLIKNKFTKITIPIIVDDDSVTTQTDLKPKNQSKERLKLTIAVSLLALILIFAIWRKKYIYLILTLIPLIYIFYISKPIKDICIKQGSNIHLLPVNNGTIFETTQTQCYLPNEGKAKGFTKVKLKDEKIGWVKNEDTCSY